MMVLSRASGVVAFAAVALVAATEPERILSADNPNNCKHFNRAPNTVRSPRPAGEFVVFGDSNSDVGRSHASDLIYDFPSIGKSPWTHLFDADNPDEKIRIYRRGIPSNGPGWARFLNIPDGLNYATGSGTASDIFRSVMFCTGYSKDNVNPTGTFDEQITQYLKEHPSPTDPARGHVHFVSLGGNDIKNALRAIGRWNAGIAAGLPNYDLEDPGSFTDPVDLSSVFTLQGGVPTSENFEPLVQELVGVHVAGVGKLLANGVTGRIMVGDLPSPKDVPVFVDSGAADALDALVRQANEALVFALGSNFAEFGDQVRMVSLYGLTAALSGNPSIFTDLGFTNLSKACMKTEFYVDDAAEVMQTQALRQGGLDLEACGDNVCALCTTADSPCPQCLTENPTATVCDCPNDHVFYDNQHLTAAFNRVLARAVYQCSLDEPNMSVPWVEQFCGGG